MASSARTPQTRPIQREREDTEHAFTARKPVPDVDAVSALRTELEAVRFQNAQLVTENELLTHVQQQFWLLLEENERLKAQRRSDRTKGRDPTTLPANQRSLITYTQVDSKSSECGTPTAMNSTPPAMLPGRVRGTQNDESLEQMRSALEECMELLLTQQYERTSSVQHSQDLSPGGRTPPPHLKGSLVPRFLAWLQEKELHSPFKEDTNAEEAEGNALYLQAELERVTATLNRMSLSREQALEELEVFQKRAAYAASELYQCQEKYIEAMKKIDEYEGIVADHRGCHQVIQSLRHRISELQDASSLTHEGSDARRVLREEAERIKAEINQREQERKHESFNTSVDLLDNV